MAATRFKLTTYDSPRAGRLAILTMDNGEDHTRPTIFDAEALASLHAALDEVEQQPDVRGEGVASATPGGGDIRGEGVASATPGGGDIRGEGVASATPGGGDIKGLMLTGKPFVFAVGADLTQFHGADEAFAREAGRAGHDAFTRLRDLPIPTLAAINGACMGGGLEIALHCDYRTVSTAAGALGFPEVFLSIVPAWGGTQLAPRLVGAASAVQAIVSNALNNNRLLRPAQAHELGFADRLVPAVDFLEASVAALERLVTGEERIDREPPPQDGLDELFAQAREEVDQRVHGATRAPYVALDLIEFAARGGDLEEGLRREEDALAELLPARQAQAAVYAFELTQQRVRRQPWKPAVPARPVRKVAVVGAGLMGSQLGSLLLRRLEVPLVMKDIDPDVLDRARQHLNHDLQQRVAAGRLTEAKARFLVESVTYTLEYSELAGSDFVIEAVVEKLDLKRRVFAEVEDVVDESCVLATNTSSLDVTAMAEGLRHPERLVGFHFFNPVAVMPLVELVRTQRTGDEAMATAFELAERLRKSAVQCADTPAFVVNRVLTRFMGACGDAADRGSDFTEVDDAVKELGLPMGPFELLGLVGPRVAAHVAATLHEAYPDRFPLNANFQMLAEAGVDGVYDWARGRVPHEEVAQRWQVDETAGRLTPDEIRVRALEAVADEVRHMLDEGVVDDARDIDTCLLLGAGWPFFMGGVCRYLDQTGVSQRLFGDPLIETADPALTPA